MQPDDKRAAAALGNAQQIISTPATVEGIDITSELKQQMGWRICALDILRRLIDNWASGNS